MDTLFQMKRFIILAAVFDPLVRRKILRKVMRNVSVFKVSCMNKSRNRCFFFITFRLYFFSVDSFFSSSYIATMPNDSNLTTINIEFWFIPFDIIMVSCSILAILFVVFFLCIIILDRTCHTVPMMLVANSCSAEVIFGSCIISMALFALENDVKQIRSHNSSCIFLGYFGYVVTAIQNFSYLLQAIYRYIVVVYPTRLFWQTANFQARLICFTWIFGFLYSIAFLFTGDIVYNVDNQICQMPLKLSFSVIYMAFCAYMVPVSMIMLVYFKLVRYVREMSKHITSVNTLSRAERELKMVRRLVTLILILVVLGLPYVIFIFMSFFDSAPKYHFRIAYIFISVSLVFVIITLFQFTEPLKASVIKILNIGSNAVRPMLT
jgi:hypothetical protein